jgi:hypothetical protein
MPAASCRTNRKRSWSVRVPLRAVSWSRSVPPSASCRKRGGVESVDPGQKQKSFMAFGRA